MANRVVVVTKQEPTFVFASEDRKTIAIWTMADAANAGTPIDPDSGDDLEYLGHTVSDIAPGIYEGGITVEQGV